MVRLSVIVVALSSVLSSLVAAKNCKNGGIYCGSGLLSRGNYITKINTHLAANQVNQTDYNEKNSLWICVAQGGIEFKELCVGGCLGNGKKDDSCGENKAAEEGAKAAEAARKREIGIVWAA
ncbi:hypothetical protein BJ875DRAFT_522018 [Amylocarpus encephaloides]|uniref:Killer toxin Kp4 domain-containing protein n=1 Tax=Amylocarpus encephaloides TaxID=45428 RepID=A0A9P8C1C1_9HELO|nr:hypothetical protein BJ875DRAFT_522018 [Amylocarpus encephaloides]